MVRGTGLFQGKTPVDNGPYLPRFDQFLDQNNVIGIFAGKLKDHRLVADSCHPGRAKHVEKLWVRQNIAPAGLDRLEAPRKGLPADDVENHIVGLTD